MLKKCWVSFLASIIIANLSSMARADDLMDMYNKVGGSIYQLYAIDKNKQTIIALGSAVAITEHYMATNCHVALAGNFLIAKINDTPYLARLCYYNQEEDLCIIDVVGVKLKPVNIRLTKSVKVGERVFAIGDPTKKDKLVSKGFVKEILSEGGYPVLQNSAPIIPGSSGGGLFDKEGNLIGITSSGVPGKPIGFAIATELILEEIDPRHAPSCMLPPQQSCKAN